MPLINLPPIDPVQLELQAATYALATEPNAAFEMLISSFLTCFNRFWNNPLLTPQQIADSLGKQGTLALFNCSQKTVAYVKSLDPTWVEPEIPYEYSFDEEYNFICGAKKEPAPVEGGSQEPESQT